ncbi:MAG: outer rane efflux protein precursor [Bacteroidetes bacterium]|nr:outer rane efflux protein precursor [Bacteroidota bacterium]
MKTRNITLICFASLFLKAEAQLRFTSVNEVQQFALEHNQENKIQKLKTLEAKENRNLSNAFLYPNITGSFNGQYNIDISETPVPGDLMGKPGATIYMKFGKEYTYNAGINVSYNILNWSSVYQSKISKVNIQLAEANSIYTKQQLKEQAGQIYYATITAQRAEEIWKQNKLIADTIEQITLQKFRDGLVDLLAVNQAKINTNQVSQQVQKTSLYAQQCVNQLKMLLAIDEKTDLQLTEKLDTGKLEILPVTILPDSHTEILKYQQKISEYEMKSSLAAFAPQISFKGYFGANQFWNSLDFSFNKQDWHLSNYVGLSISIPIFAGFANKSKYNAAKIEKQIAQIAYYEEITNNALKDNILSKNYFTSISVVNSSLEKVRLSKENMRLAEQKYNQGLINLTDYLETFNTNLSIQNQYLTDLSEYLSIKSTIESRK